MKTESKKLIPFVCGFSGLNDGAICRAALSLALLVSSKTENASTYGSSLGKTYARQRKPILSSLRTLKKRKRKKIKKVVSHKILNQERLLFFIIYFYFNLIIFLFLFLFLFFFYFIFIYFIFILFLFFS